MRKIFVKIIILIIYANILIPKIVLEIPNIIVQILLILFLMAIMPTLNVKLFKVVFNIVKQFRFLINLHAKSTLIVSMLQMPMDYIA